MVANGLQNYLFNVQNIKLNLNQFHVYIRYALCLFFAKHFLPFYGGFKGLQKNSSAYDYASSGWNVQRTPTRHWTRATWLSMVWSNFRNVKISLIMVITHFFLYKTDQNTFSRNKFKFIEWMWWWMNFVWFLTVWK